MMNTSTTPTTRRGEQARNQLITAAIAQFGEYGLNATTREIAAQAQQNIAAIPYYFGSKDDLYMACAQWIADFISTRFQPHAEAAEALFRQSSHKKAEIHELIFSACEDIVLLLTHDDTLHISKFISREQLSPTSASQLIHQQVISPLHSYLTRLIAAYTGRDADDTETILHTHALLGEVLVFRLCRETILLRTGWNNFDEQKSKQIFSVVKCHLALILEGLSCKESEI